MNLLAFARSFNPRAPCGARLVATAVADLAGTFQSTRPVRGATGVKFPNTVFLIVSIHAPRAGRDPRSGDNDRADDCFNPRAPCGARLCYNSVPSLLQSFNPRAPCGARHVLRETIDELNSFNPRAPCGARQQKMSRPPSFATYLWVFPSTNTIFSALKSHTPPAI